MTSSRLPRALSSIAALALAIIVTACEDDSPADLVTIQERATPLNGRMEPDGG